MTETGLNTPEKVIFRFWDGEVIALFPEIPATMHPTYCQSYIHIGQHGAANPVMVGRRSRTATPNEYRSLARELRGRGYRLEIRKRMPHDHVETRIKELRSIR